MRLKIRPTFSLLILLLIFACDNENVSKQVSYNINTRQGMELKEMEIDLADVVKDVYFIPLETSDKCLLSGVSNVVLTEEYILVTDARSLYQFGKQEGNFIRQIGQIGNGPSEHGTSIKFNVNENTGEVFIFSSSYKITVHDLFTGKFKRGFNLPFRTSKFDFVQGNKCLFFTMEFGQMFDPSLVEIYITDKNGIKLDSISDDNRLKNNNNVAGTVLFYRKNNYLNYMGHYKDTLYRLSDNLKKHSYVAFNSGNSVRWEDLIIEPVMNGKLDNFIAVTGVLESDNYFFLTLQLGIPSAGEERVYQKMIFDKRTQKSFPVEGLTDSSCGGIQFWPQCISGNTLIGYYPAYELLKSLESQKDNTSISGDILKIFEDLNENDNPVLVMATY